MFNPEFRVMFTREAHNEMFPLIDNHIVSAIVVCGFNVFCILSLGWIAYKTLYFGAGVAQCVWSLIWESLTPGNELVEITLILSSLVATGIMFSTMKRMADLLDEGFVKLKNEIKAKDEHIKELEEVIAAKNALIIKMHDEAITNLEESITNFQEDVSDNCDKSGLESWSTGKILD